MNMADRFYAVGLIIVSPVSAIKQSLASKTTL
jgi:hypothetical protein